MTVKDVQTWGQVVFVTKEFVADSAVDVPGFLELQFLRTLPEGAEVQGDPTYEWVDLDAPENVNHRMMMTPEDGEPPKNMWLVRITARIV